MFITKRKHEIEMAGAQMAIALYRSRYHDLLKQWNDLVTRINKLGGMSALNNKPSPALSDDDIKRLLMLCHPDKHDGKQSAVEMTQKLLAMRGAQS